MSSSAFTVHSHLPPTTNALDSQQRLRLMRSTRKLGAVLGTTPFLLEDNTSFALLPLGKVTSKALKRQGSIFTHHQSSSLSLASSSTSLSSSHHPSPSASSIALPQCVTRSMQSSEMNPSNPPGLPCTSRRLRSGDKAPQLYLRLNTAPVPLADDRLTALLPPTPSTPCPPTPLSPLPDVGEIRRKRMAKLARHLGEHIPAELVSASGQSPELSRPHPVRRRSQSVHVTRSEEISRPSFTLTRQDWVGEWNRSNIKDVQKELRNLRVR